MCGLTRLCLLDSCNLNMLTTENASARNAALAALTNLVHLEVVHRPVGSKWVTGHTLAAFSKLSHLNLYLTCDECTLAVMLVNLRHLSLAWVAASFTTISALEPLQQLTALHLVCEFLRHPGLVLDSSTTPFLTRLTALQELRVTQGSTLSASLFTSFRALRYLHLWGVSFTPSTAAVLEQLPRLQHLSALWIDLNHTSSPAPAAAYAGITAHSRLCSLHINWQDLPVSAWHALFPAGVQFEQLTQLQLYEGCGTDDAADGVLSAVCTLDGAVLCRLAACCPRLLVLKLWLHRERETFFADLMA